MHSAPAYRYGLSLGLAELGFTVHQSDSIDVSARIDWDACLMHVPSADVSAIARLRRARPSRTVVALLNEPTVDSYHSALRVGATGLVTHDADIGEIGEVLRCALRGNVRLPIAVVRALVDRTTVAPGELVLSGSETELLRQLASGRTVADIAKSRDYSERQMYRLVRDLYHRVGARNRSEAIATTAKWGLLADANHIRRAVV
ncbi:hypothetical protein [Embleya sp. AB8]|uniref:hypothetical protein n=1 Tax=Embleya sp. AB8 TaxID=3156304 RepID=UPI003C72D50B